MDPVLQIILALVVGTILGVVSLFILVRRIVMASLLKNGPWMTSLGVGTRDAGWYTSVAVAATALFALGKKETIYYVAETDEDGDRLHAGQAYRIEGRDPPARWWSVTLYGRDHLLVPNERKIYTVNKNNVEREADGRFRIVLARESRQRNWIPMGERDQVVEVVLRLYNPEASVYEHPDTVELPRLRKEPVSS